MLFSSFGDTIFALFIFCTVLFLYLHVHFHLKTSDDLELYEIDNISKEKLEDICDLRQPTMFDCPLSESVLHSISKTSLCQHYPSFDIKIKDKSTHTEIPLALNVACKYFDTTSADDATETQTQTQTETQKEEKDKETEETEEKEDNKEKNTKYSEGNHDFLQETGAIKHMTYNDSFLRPPLVSNCAYDVMFAANAFESPFKYEMNYRNFYVVTQGSVRLKLAPPKSKKYLSPEYDYESFEFTSPVNPWSPSNIHLADFEKVKCLDITLQRGQMIYIPAYWWFSFKFNANASVACFKYRTYMNNIAISPHIFMYGLQNQNIVHKLSGT